MPTETTVAQRHRRDADGALIAAAGEDLAALARSGAAVMAARRYDPTENRAAHEAHGDACLRLVVHFARNPCELFQFLRLVGLEAAARGWSGDSSTTCPEGPRS